MPMLSNVKWEKVCLGVARGMTQAEAYAGAGYKVSDLHSAEAACSRLLKRPEMISRILELQTKAAEQTGVTIESMIQLGLDIIKDARAAEDYTAASSTFERLAKVAGLWVDRSETKSTMTRLISDRPAKPDDEEAWLRQHAPNAPAGRPLPS